MPRVGRQNNHAKSASSLVLCGRSARSPRGEMRASRAPQSSETLIPAFRSHSRRPGAVSVKRSLGQRRGVERAPRWPQRQSRQVRSAQYVLCGRSAGYPSDLARARLTPRGYNSTATTVRSRSRQPGAVSVKRSLGQRRGVERAPRWPRRQPRQVRGAQCMVRGRSAGSPWGGARAGRAPRD